MSGPRWSRCALAGRVEHLPVDGDPPELAHVLCELRAAKHAGEPFAIAWPRAVEDIPLEWRNVLRATAEEWRLCFEDQPSRWRMIAHSIDVAVA